MKKNIKIILIVLSVLVGIILLDTLQAKVFNNKHIIKIVEYYDGGNFYQKHKGILVDTYVYTDGSQKTYYKWTNRLYDETNEKLDITLEDVNDKINNYFSKDNVDKSNIAHWAIDGENNVVVVGMLDISVEKQNEFINNVFSSCCGSKYIKYIKNHKMIEFKESIDIFDAEIIETKEDYMIVKVLKESKSFKKDDKVRMKITRPTSGINDFYVVGNKVRITFNGMVETSNPAQIGTNKVELITN